MIQVQRAIHLTVALGMLSTACADAEAPVEPGLQVLAINDGVVESGYPYVGQFISDADGPGGCSASLIGPRWLLTARHCINPALNKFTFGSESDVEKKIYSLEGSQTFFQPTEDPKNEVQLIYLAEEVDIQQRGELHDDPLSVVMTECTGVGFGDHREPNGDTTDGIKRSLSSRVDSADANKIKVTELTGTIQGGDSGGPLICDGKIVGVARLRAEYSTVDSAWIHKRMADPSAPQEPRPVLPPLPDFVPAVRLDQASGDLCPEGSIEFIDGFLVIIEPPGSSSSSATPTCAIDLTVTVPQGRKLGAPKFCHELYASSPTNGEATLSYSVAGREAVQFEHPAPVNSTNSRACDVVDVEIDACGASQAIDVSIHVDITAPEGAGETVELRVFDSSLTLQEGTNWSTCAP